jgi:hypothetical protein
MITCSNTDESNFQILDPISVAPPGTNPLAYVEPGLTQLTQGVQTKVVTFQVTKAGAYSFVEAEIINTLDNPALNLDFEFIATSLTGFTIKLNGLPDTSNSYLRWLVQVLPT